MGYRLSSDYIIKTERLTVRSFAERDKADMLEIQSNPLMVKYTPDEPWKDEKDWYDFFAFASTFYDEEKDWCPDWFRYFFAIRKKGNDKVIGYSGLGAPEYDRSVTEVFYGISPDYWGKGYATEAAKAMLEFGFEQLKLDEIIGFREDGNPASGRVLEKAGLRMTGKVENVAAEFSYYENEPLYKITSNEFFCNC